MEPIRGRRHYTSPDEDSARWDRLERREGDIVISTRTKHGTTWMQTICALLVHGTDIPGPIADLSPWLDWTIAPIDEVVARLDAQPHRRIIKTHTPLDGVPIDPAVTYVVVARHPLDAAVSLFHQRANIDRTRWAELTGNAAPDPPPDPEAGQAEELHDALVAWTAMDLDAYGFLDFLPGVAHHYADAWARRREGNVVLVHYDDLQRDLAGAMRRIAARLGIALDGSTLPDLVVAASFSAMKARADDAVPDRSGVLRSSERFFREGRSGAYREVLDAAEITAYDRRVTALIADVALRAWLHGEGPGLI